MHLLHMLERWAAPNAPLDLEKRQTTRTGGLNIPLTSDLSSVLAPPATTSKDQPATTDTPTTTQTQAQNTQPTTQPTTSNKPTTTAQTTNNPATTSSKPATTSAPSSTNKGTLVTITSTPGSTDAPASVTDTPAITSGTTKAAAAKTSSSSGDSGVNGVDGKTVGTAIGVVAGVVGGFAVIIFAIFIWRRHQRRKQMERIGSMEELPRAPSPGPLSRSFTRGGGARQPIDDDDDDFLTPMDTLPNNHRMDEWDASKSSPQHSDNAMYDDKSVYAESVYHEDGDYDQNYHDQSFPQVPPPAMTADNGRFYSGDFSNMGQAAQYGSAASPPPGTAVSPTNTGNAGGAIPVYSAMNKYAALTAPGGPGAAVTSPSSTSPVYGATPVNQPRPGGGYRAHDSYDAGGYV